MLCDNLILFFTGFSRYSAQIQEVTRDAISDKTNQLLKTLALVDDAELILTGRGDLGDFGRLLDCAWELKRGVADVISNSFVDEYYAKAKKAGALGGKLLGAGGGGFLLFYVEPDKQPAVKKALEDLLYVPFNFEDHGTRIVHFSPESFTLPEDCNEVESVCVGALTSRLS